MELPGKLANFLSERCVHKVACSSVSADEHGAGNLTSDDLLPHSRGFRVEHFIRPPVSLEFQFKCPLHVACVLIQPNLAEGAEMRAEIYGSMKCDDDNGEWTRISDSVTVKSNHCLLARNKIFERRFGSVLESREAVLGSRLQPALPTLNLTEVGLKQPHILHALRNLKITVTRLTGVRPLALKRVEVWAALSNHSYSYQREQEGSSQMTYYQGGDTHSLKCLPRQPSPLPAPSSAVGQPSADTRSKGRVLKDYSLPIPGSGETNSMEELLVRPSERPSSFCRLGEREGKGAGFYQSYKEEESVIKSSLPHGQHKAGGGRDRGDHGHCFKYSSGGGPSHMYSSESNLQHLTRTPPYLEHSSSWGGFQSCGHSLLQHPRREGGRSQGHRCPSGGDGVQDGGACYGGGDFAKPWLKLDTGIREKALQLKTPEGRSSPSLHSSCATSSSLCELHPQHRQQQRSLALPSLVTPSPRASSSSSSCVPSDRAVVRSQSGHMTSQSGHMTSQSGHMIPEAFLDEITCELMVLPMQLPSGHYVDRSTLDKLAAADASYGRPPLDPFTGVSFSEAGKPQFCTRLKLQLDRFVSALESRRLARQTSSEGLDGCLLGQTSSTKLVETGGRTVGSAHDIAAHLKRIGSGLPSNIGSPSNIAKGNSNKPRREDNQQTGADSGEGERGDSEPPLSKRAKMATPSSTPGQQGAV